MPPNKLLVCCVFELLPNVNNCFGADSAGLLLAEKLNPGPGCDAVWLDAAPKVNKLEFDTLSFGFVVEKILGAKAPPKFELLLFPKTEVDEPNKTVLLVWEPNAGVVTTVAGVLNTGVVFSAFPNTEILLSDVPKIDLLSEFPNTGTLVSDVPNKDDLFSPVAKVGVLVSPVPNATVVFISTLLNNGIVLDTLVKICGAIGVVSTVLTVVDGLEFPTDSLVPKENVGKVEVTFDDDDVVICPKVGVVVVCVTVFASVNVKECWL